MGQAGGPYVPEAGSPLTGESHLPKDPNWESPRSAYRCPLLCNLGFCGSVEYSL